MRSYLTLLFVQLVGELLTKAAHLPLPGAVLGMVLLAAWYIAQRKTPDTAMDQASGALLKWMGLLFVPAGVGVVANLALLRSEWVPISVTIVVSTLLTLLTTAWIMHRLTRASRLTKEAPLEKEQA